MKLKNKLLLSTILLGLSANLYASIEECYKAGLNKEYKEAIELCKPYAENKDYPEASGVLAGSYAQEKDYKNALKYSLWLSNYYDNHKPESANEHDTYTLTLTTAGNIYYFGQAGKADKTKGLEYITKAANLGNSLAEKQLGGMYVSGQNGDLKQNFATGYKWTEIAIANGNEEAKSSYLMTNFDVFEKEYPYCLAMGEQLVAQAYIDGSAGLPKDNSKAKEYLNQAIALYQDNKPTAENTKYCPTGANKLNLESAKKELGNL
ncbi:SEL1-like repeat protein [Francisella sp. SYW-2]|uniref:SEL1-like repeat protein n=1 Tax=Francisella sp. SYW-2 TaxID=2610886 RepID=UPI00123CD920|nr:SEL1-like repeat protein [Francisella sp. SYW-2]